MKISELIEMLQEVKIRKGDLDVLISVDEEGNGFKHLHDVATYHYRDDSGGIEIYGTKDLEDCGYEPDELPIGLIFWP